MDQRCAIGGRANLGQSQLLILQNGHNALEYAALHVLERQRLHFRLVLKVAAGAARISSVAASSRSATAALLH